MKDPVLDVTKLGKKYCRTLRRSMLYGLGDIARDFIGVSTKPDRLRQHEFWALRDATFQLQPGRSLGVIGRNGSGKTTLLKLLAGIVQPDLGTLTVQCRTGSLIEIGAGFHPLLTGRENIFINGMILGMSRQEIIRHFDAIVEFAEIGNFIDGPVRNYSSGMYVRLGFAIAVHAPVNLLLIDEVLAVGDLAFSQKCVRKLLEFRSAGGTVVLVTHAMKNVKFLCDEALWIDNSEVKQTGSALEVVDAYETHVNANAETGGQVLAHDDCVDVLEVRYPEAMRVGERLEVEIDFEFQRPIQQPIFNFHLFANTDETLVVSHHSDLEGYNWDLASGKKRLRIATEPLWLRSGTYLITFSVSEGHMNNPLLGYYKCYKIVIQNPHEIYGILDGRVTFELSDQHVFI